VGFSKPLHSPPFSLAFYGTSSCANVPFNEDDASFGCPTNNLAWVELGKVRVSGSNSWQQAAIEFSPSRDIEAVAIGPDCVRNPSAAGIYYFLDKLVLADSQAFDFAIRSLGNPCTGEARLSMPAHDGLSYQWYKDGIALLGETGPKLDRAPEAGAYQVRQIGPNGCSLTQAFFYQVPVERSLQEVSICRGTTYDFNGQLVQAEGVYFDTLRSNSNCDSIVELRLDVQEAILDTVYAKIFASEDFTFGGRRFDRPGEYSLRFTSEANCDSLVTLVLDRYRVFIPNAFSPNGDGENDRFSILGGEELRGVPELRIYDRWGAEVYAARDLGPTDGWDGRTGGQPAPGGIYLYQARILFDDQEERAVLGTVTLLR